MVAIENRNYPRFYLIDEVYVSVVENDGKIAKLKDISMGGLAYHHLFDKEFVDANKDITLNIIDMENNVTITNIPGKIVYETKPDKGNSQNGWFNCSGVRFNDLEPLQEQQLKTIIKNHGQFDENRL